nr:serine carboxypeptidase II-3 [Tanacetum cinerariifolium]
MVVKWELHLSYGKINEGRPKWRWRRGGSGGECHWWMAVVSDCGGEGVTEAVRASYGQLNQVKKNAKEDHLLKCGLPGQPKTSANFKQYAGSIIVNELAGRSLFYYFVEASSNSYTKPLILWLNGGPGCSSLGMGAFTEIGPFGVYLDGRTLYARQFSWNKVANVLFIESPVGVGFSYSNTTNDYISSGDNMTAEDMYNFLRKWFERYPVFKGRDFFMTGESYVGYYVPVLADIILRNFKGDSQNSSPMMNLKGIMLPEPTRSSASHSCNTTGLPYPWAPCSDLISEQWKDSPLSVIPIYKRIIDHGLRILLYSGDVDACVPFTSLRYAIAAMDLQIIQPWQKWTMPDMEQPAGYKIVYDGLTYATVRGAGHELRTSSNPRQQATINNERVTIQPIQGRQNSMTAGSSKPYTSGSSGTSGKQRVIVCYNCKGEGHMSKQCTKPKRKRDKEWFKDKVLLVQAQANRQVLQEEELEFLADLGIVETLNA